jgi:hypothetical protein
MCISLCWGPRRHSGHAVASTLPYQVYHKGPGADSATLYWYGESVRPLCIPVCSCLSASDKPSHVIHPQCRDGKGSLAPCREIESIGQINLTRGLVEFQHDRPDPERERLNEIHGAGLGERESWKAALSIHGPSSTDERLLGSPVGNAGV